MPDDDSRTLPWLRRASAWVADAQAALGEPEAFELEFLAASLIAATARPDLGTEPVRQTLIRIALRGIERAAASTSEAGADDATAKDLRRRARELRTEAARIAPPPGSARAHPAFVN
jgi:hypothetical protein